MKRTFVRLALVAPLALTAACGGGAQTTPLVENVDEVTAATEAGDFAALVAQGDAHWENRSDRAEVEAALAAWEAATRVETGSDVDRNAALYPVYVKLSQGWYWLAHAHIRWEVEPDEALMAAYERGMEFGEIALALNNEAWTRALTYEQPIPDAVAVLQPSDVPAVYWYATNLGRWAIVRGIATVLSKVTDIKAMMDRVEAMDPDYFYGAPDRYFGVYYTKLPFGNPDLDQSRRRFESSIERFPQYLETRILLADDWARVTNNRAIAEEQCRYVLEADISQWPELLPENMNAQRRAQFILDNIDEYFR